MKYRLVIIGFGTVGQGFAEILQASEVELKEQYGMDCDVVAISDPIKGSVYEEDGLELRKILSLVKKTGKLDGYPEGIKGWDSIRTITSTPTNVVVEVTPTDIKTGEPAITHIKTALSNKKHVITTNKGPVALAYHELANLATSNEVSFRFEGTVLAGTPALNLGLEALGGIEIREIRGILNGTTNYILTEMERGRTYSEVLIEAQKLGYAEAKPAADVEGWDAVAKVVILANTLMGGNIKIDEVERKGITHLTLKDIEEARQENKSWKLIGRVWEEGGKILAKVTPERVESTDFLANIKGATNAITFTTDYLNGVTIIGPGAGRKETGFAILSDLLNIHRVLKSVQ